MEISNSSLNLERVASWASRRWGRAVLLTLVSGVIYGGVIPPIPKRADCIIPSQAGQAIDLAFRFDPLIEQCHQVNLFAVDQHARGFHAQIGKQNGCQRGIEDGDKLARTF